jgi:predicted enzyme related to lactoylglutathione lyase
MTGPVVWFEVLGSDSARSQAFYGDLFGWKFRPSPGMPSYGVVEVEGTLGGGVGETPDAPQLTFYVSVDDAQATLDRAVAAGGSVISPPRRYPHGDILAMMRDPDGLAVGLVQQG